MSDENQDGNFRSKMFSKADMFHLLSLFLMPVTSELAEGVRQGVVGKDVDAIFDDLGIDHGSVPSEGLLPLCGDGRSAEDVFIEMRRDRTKLFAHPERPLIPISEMRFVDVRANEKTPSISFLNEAALHAEQCYREAGLALSDEGSREPGDHIGIELEFLAYLHVCIGVASREGNEVEMRRWGDALTRFSPHIERWGLDFFAACEQCACGVVYPWLGRVGTAFLEKCFEETP